jgi:transposase-like protein
MEKLLLERGIVVSCEAVRCWAKKFGPDYAGRLRWKAPSGSETALRHLPRTGPVRRKNNKYI